MAKELTRIEIKLDNIKEVKDEEYWSIARRMFEPEFELVIRHRNPHNGRAYNRDKDVVLKINKI